MKINTILLASIALIAGNTAFANNYHFHQDNQNQRVVVKQVLAAVNHAHQQNNQGYNHEHNGRWHTHPSHDRNHQHNYGQAQQQVQQPVVVKKVIKVVRPAPVEVIQYVEPPRPVVIKEVIVQPDRQRKHRKGNRNNKRKQARQLEKKIIAAQKARLEAERRAAHARKIASQRAAEQRRLAAQKAKLERQLQNQRGRRHNHDNGVMHSHDGGNQHSHGNNHQANSTPTTHQYNQGGWQQSTNYSNQNQQHNHGSIHHAHPANGQHVHQIGQ